MAVDLTGDLDIAAGTEMWMMWAEIASRHAELAGAGRADLEKAYKADQDWGPGADAELKSAMIAISAAAISLDAFGMRIKQKGVVPTRPQSPKPSLAPCMTRSQFQEPSRAQWLWAELKAGFEVTPFSNLWPKELKKLFGLRNSTAGGLVHARTVMGLPRNHPVLPNVTGARATFTTETAEWAVGFMRSVYDACRGAARPGLAPEMAHLQGALRKVSQSPGY